MNERLMEDQARKSLGRARNQSQEAGNVKILNFEE